MLQIKKVKKQYVTGDLKQTALNEVSLNLRDNEFVAILGPSGSGKTTLLNIIGGLDRYDSGDLIINGISTKKYKDRDWDSYRNHTIGFVFQSYNLIEHQSILSNVEIALTISGVKRSERRKRARIALEKVGLGDQVHKRPNQLSGGQMQRVAIARALVNDPDILLADEPTGALDTETSIQVMELLKEVASDRLVVMVTHNPELAEKYATRIVNICDGQIIGDTDPCPVDEEKQAPPKHENMGKASMSLFTALSLSFNNLLTKKARTLLTSFAGSIGIIGIALILSLSTGVNNYITDVQRDTMSSYPITIEAQTMDLQSLMDVAQDKDKSEVDHKFDAVYSDSTAVELESSITTSFKENNLTNFKKYLDDNNSEIHQYVGDNGIVYSYDAEFGVYTYDPEGKFVNLDGSTLYQSNSTQYRNQSMQYASQFGMDAESMGLTVYSEILPGPKDQLISNVVSDNYTVVKGEWPDSYDEIVLVLDKNNEIPLTTLYQLGLLPGSDYETLMKQIDNGEKPEIKMEKFSYDEILNKTFKMIPACDLYVKNDAGIYAYIGNDPFALEGLMNSAAELKISGIIKPVDDADVVSVKEGLAYTRLLTEYLMDYTDNSDVVKAQIASPEINITTGMKFAPEDDQEKIKDVKEYVASMGITDKANLYKTFMSQAPAEQQAQIAQLGEEELAKMLDQYIMAADDATLITWYDYSISAGTYDDNMALFGVISKDAPSTIAIYCDTFEAKDGISACIEKYNDGVAEVDQITYTDYIGLLLSSITTIINVISYVLIAFVSVSLVVSSIMIGIITYISVLERTKEIGILRAMGASKRNVSQVFLSESFIIGLCAGLIGVLITLLLLVPANVIIHAVAGTSVVSAALPVAGAVVLVLLSVVLTTIAGLFPSRKAARKDPVTALRTE